MDHPCRLLLLAPFAALAVTGVAHAASTDVLLASTASFGILAGSGITDTGPSTVIGDTGTFPTTAFTGQANVTVTGTNHGGDATTQLAKNDLVTAYNDAAGQGPTTTESVLTGLTLPRGVYTAATALSLTGNLTLDGQNDPSSVFVFQAGTTLVTDSASSITLINGAQPCHVYWAVGSSATLGTNSSFVGTILAMDDITATTGATINGRLLARNGAVTLDTNTITRSACTAPVLPPPTPTPTVGTTATTTTDSPVDSGPAPESAGTATTTTTGTGTAAAGVGEIVVQRGASTTAARRRAAATAAAHRRAKAAAAARKRAAAAKRRAARAKARPHPARSGYGFTG